MPSTRKLCKPPKACNTIAPVASASLNKASSNPSATLTATVAIAIVTSQLIAGMKQKGINLDRKVLADLAVNQPEAFKTIVNTVKEK